MYCADINDGSVLWKYKTQDDIVSTPAVINDIVCFGSIDKWVYALDKVTGKLRWKFETKGFVESSPAFINGNIIIGSDDYSLYCLDSASGKLEWRFTTKEDKIVSSPTVVGDHILVGT